MRGINIEYIKKLFKLAESKKNSYPCDYNPYTWLYKTKGKTSSAKYGEYDFICKTECDWFILKALRKHIEGKYFKFYYNEDPVQYIYVLSMSPFFCYSGIGIKINYINQQMQIVEKSLLFNDIISIVYQEVTAENFKTVSNYFTK